MTSAEFSSAIELAGITAGKWFRSSDLRIIAIKTSSNRQFITKDTALLYFDVPNMVIRMRNIEKQSDGTYVYPSGYDETDDTLADAYFDVNSIASFIFLEDLRS
jgi:hypothetical protein